MNRVSRRSAAETAEALLEAGRTEPALDYDVELGLARHHDWLRSEAPMPEWGMATATKSLSAVLIKTLVSTVLVGALATAAWQARNVLQPSAATGHPSSPGGVATQPAVPDATASEAEAAMAPIPIPVPDHAVPSDYPARRAARAEVTDKRATRNHRAQRDARVAGARADAMAPHAASAARAEAASTRVSADDRAAAASARADHAASAAALGAEVAAAAANPEAARAAPAERKPLKSAQKPQQPDDLIEMQQVATAEQLLERSPARALTLVRQGDQRFAQGYFQQERAYIAIMALIRLGRVDEARARAASFAKQFPALPYGTRIRSALDVASRGSAP